MHAAGVRYCLIDADAYMLLIAMILMPRAAAAITPFRLDY